MRMVRWHLSRLHRGVERLLEYGPAVLVAAMHLDRVRPLRFQAAGQQSKVHRASKRRGVLLAPERVDACAEDIDEPVRRTLGGAGEQRPIKPHSPRLSTHRRTGCPD